MLKGAILLYLIRRTDFTYFVDGAIYGFTVGIGFAIIENFEYVLSNPSAALTLALMRVLSVNLIHATACGSIGIALGLSRFERSGSLRRIGILLLAILVAVGIHMAFNNLVSDNAPLLLAILLGMGGGFFIYIIMRQGLKIMKGWVDEQISQEQSVTNREASIVRKFENVDDILVDFSKRFGAEKTALAKEILLAQAQMGIYRKTAEKHQDEKMRKAAAEQVEALREKMNENRKKMGAYRMLFLRNIFPEDASPLWGRLETILQERMAPKEKAGTGLWTALNTRVPKDRGKGADRMTSELIHLRKAFLFQGLPDDVLAALAQKLTRQKLAKGQVLFRRGDQGNSLFIIDEGRIKIVREDAQGGELVLNYCEPGEAIGEMSLFDKEPRSAGVVAVTDSEVLELKRDAFFDLIDTRPDVSLVLLQSLSSRLRFASTYIQKAIEWSKRIAEGDYSLMDQMQTEQAVSDEDKAGQLLSAFFQMVKGVKAREEDLKQQVQKLTLIIDETKRKQEFEELTSTEFYSKLKLQAQMIREQRKDKS